MKKTPQDKLKRQIITLIAKNGRPVRTQYLMDHVSLPEYIVMNDLLTALVAERLLVRSFTLLANGDAECTYDLLY